MALTPEIVWQLGNCHRCSSVGVSAEFLRHLNLMEYNGSVFVFGIYSPPAIIALSISDKTPERKATVIIASLLILYTLPIITQQGFQLIVFNGSVYYRVLLVVGCNAYHFEAHFLLMMLKQCVYEKKGPV